MKSLIPLFLLSAAPLLAEALPQLGGQAPWLGQYAGTENRDFRFIVKTDGQGQLMPAKEKGGFVTDNFAIRFVSLIEETLPDGKVVSKMVKEDAWEAVTPAAKDPKKVTYRGTVAGDAKFEVNFELEKGAIRAGGKILDKGQLSNPRFVMRIQVPFVYLYEKDAEKLKEKVKNDRMEVVRTDGKKLKLEMDKPLDAETAEYSGPGITQARIEIAYYGGHKLDVATTPGAAFELWNKEEKALIEGFTLGWKHDAAKDPEGKARLTFQLK
ncbi:hypothetical protein [Luteolibacter sp. Populi]|uniref:hypothetical protein n=1 Tax=Luteolibacter sp. Populi TaxID=3230487 RepID=UPI003467453A